MAFLALPDVDLYFEESGAGAALLYVGGTGSDLRNPPNPLRMPFMSGFRGIAYDHRGLGQSLPRDPDSQPTMADFACDALALADHLGIDTFCLVGVSFGGMVAQEIAVRAPERIEKLVLMCTSSGGEGGSSQPLHQVYRLEPEVRDRALAGLVDSRAGNDADVDAFLGLMASNRAQLVVTQGLLRQLDARAHHDTWDRLANLTMPTMIAAGRFDPMAPLVNSEALHRAIPGSVLRTYDGGHPFFYQDRQAFIDIAAFLGT
jgi:3-oxoadipate enol-lactonase